MIYVRLIPANTCDVSVTAHLHSPDQETAAVDGILKRPVLAPGALNTHLPPALLGNTNLGIARKGCLGAVKRQIREITEGARSNYVNPLNLEVRDKELGNLTCGGMMQERFLVSDFEDCVHVCGGASSVFTPTTQYLRILVLVLCVLVVSITLQTTV